MRVLVNVLPVAPDGGVATYTTELFDELFDGGHEYVLLCSTTNEELFAKYAGESVRVVVLPISTARSPVRVFLEQVLVPLLALYWRADLLFAPRNIVPALNPIPSVVVMHSMHLNYEYGIDDISLLQRIYGAVVLPTTVRRATRVVAISETVRDTLADHLPVDAADIDVVYHGAGLEPTDAAQTNDTDAAKAAKSPLPSVDDVSSPYVLFLSQLAWHKNAHRLLAAFARVKETAAVDHTLVIAGKDINGNRARLEALADEHGIAEDVTILGRVPQEAITPLYRHADVFVYPSAIEGFGLPPLEAMANGTPVVGSDRTAVPEIIGDAGVIVDPDDTDALAEAIERVLTDSDLRTKLVERGFDRIQDFSWDRTAAETRRILEDAGEYER